MKSKATFCFISVFAISALICPAVAQVVLNPDTVITIYKAPFPPVIDGELDSMWQVVTEFAIAHTFSKEEPTDENDFSGTFRAMWDDKHLYYFIDIKDDILFRDHPNDQIWRDDCIELYIDGDNSKLVGEYDKYNDWQVLISYDDPPNSFYIGPNSVNPDVKLSDIATLGVSAVQGVGWTAEIAFICEALNMIPFDGLFIGLEFDIDDDDDGSTWDSKFKAFAIEVHETNWNASTMGTAILSGELVPTAVEDEIHNLPDKLYLSQNFPNPFNPCTEIAYSIPEQNSVTLEVYNLLGVKVATLINNEVQAAGSHRYTFDASQLESGIYLYRLQIGSEIVTKKMILLQ